MRVINFDDHVAQKLDRTSFASQRQCLRWITLLLAILTGLAITIGMLTTIGMGPALFLGLLTAVSGAAWVIYERRYQSCSQERGQLQSGLRGQRHLAEILALLGDSYYLLNNLNLPGRADDVDHVVVGPNGIFALEAKNHRGRIFWQDGQWRQSKISRNGRPQPEEPIRDPILQVKRNIDYLRTCINHTAPELGRRTHLWIEGVVVFTHPAVSLDLPPDVEEQLPFPVLRARDLPAFIQGHVPRYPYSRADVREIVSMFGHLQDPNCSQQGEP